MSLHHRGVSCDVCYERNFDGVRYYCLVCNNYDLCEVCYQERRYNKEHISYHPTQPVLFGQDALGDLDQVVRGEESIFICPFCGDKDFDPAGLLKHCKRYHFNDSRPVRCPICPVYKQGITRLLSNSFLEHLLDLHKNQCMGKRGPPPLQPETPECAICMEVVPRTSDMKILRCLHKFHKNCINCWLEDNSTCPVCRAPA